MDALARVLDGAVDLHCHSGPSPMPRRITHAEAAQQAERFGFRAIVVKCHYHSTVTDVLAMKPQLDRIRTKVYGGIALNSQVGGLNPHAADLAVRMGAKIIWFPTISAGAHLCHSAADETIRRHFVPLGVMQSDEVDILDDRGDIRPEVRTILRIARDSGTIVSTGHLAPDRALALIELARAEGLTRLIVSHPNFVVGADVETAGRMAGMGAVIEHEMAMYYNARRFPIQTLLDWIDRVGPEHTSLGSDLGQVDLPLPMEGYRNVCEQLLDAGIPERDLRTMVVHNPARLLGLDPL